MYIHITLLFTFPFAASTSDTSPTYKAAVLQGFFAEALTTQASLVESFVQNASNQDVQILVFGESALGSDTALSHRSTCETLPNPKTSATDLYLCSTTNTSSTPLASQISCLAAKYNIVLVFAMCDVQGDAHYNTQLAINNDGKLLAKYHKMHLYDTSPGIGESTHASYPVHSDPTYFDTSFGVRFGMHTCFDMAFSTPGAAMALDLSLGITDFVFPTGWVIESPPMLPPNEFQQGWSRGVNVNLLAADSAHSIGSSGSGIYSRGQVLIKRWSPHESFPDTGHLLVAVVPKLKRTVSNVQVSPPNWNYKTTRNVIEIDVDVDAAVNNDGVVSKVNRTITTAPLVLTTFIPSHNVSKQMQSVTTKTGFTCQFDYVVPSKSNSTNSIEVYGLVANDGVWLNGVVKSRSCLVFRCRDAECSVDPMYTTVGDLDAATLFESFELKGNFTGGDLILPMLVTNGGDIVDDDEEVGLQFQGGTLIVRSWHRPLLNAMLYSPL